jgi:hypothetical protein
MSTWRQYCYLIPLDNMYMYLFGITIKIIKNFILHILMINQLYKFKMQIITYIRMDYNVKKRKDWEMDKYINYFFLL